MHEKMVMIFSFYTLKFGWVCTIRIPENTQVINYFLLF